MLIVVLSGSFRQSSARQREEAGIRAALAQGLKAYPGAHLADLTFERSGRALTVTAVVRSSGAVSPAKVAALQSRLPTARGEPLVLQIRSVITKTATAHGYVQESQENGTLATPSGTDTDPRPSGSPE